MDCRLLPRWMMWCGWPGTVSRARRAMVSKAIPARSDGETRVPKRLEPLQAELREQGAQALRGTFLTLPRPASQYELVFQTVFPAHQFGHGNLVAARLEVKATQHIGQLAAQFA